MIRVVCLEYTERVTAGAGGQHSRVTYPTCGILTGQVNLHSRIAMFTKEMKYEPVACSETKTRQCRGKEETDKMRERTPRREGDAPRSGDDAVEREKPLIPVWYRAASRKRRKTHLQALHPPSGKSSAGGAACGKLAASSRSCLSFLGDPGSPFSAAVSAYSSPDEDLASPAPDALSRRPTVSDPLSSSPVDSNWIGGICSARWRGCGWSACECAAIVARAHKGEGGRCGPVEFCLTPPRVGGSLVPAVSPRRLVHVQ